MTKNKVYLALPISIFLTSCANIVPKYNYKKPKSQNTFKTQTPSQTINQFRKESQARELDSTIISENITKRDETFLMPVRNDKVKFWIKYYTTRNKDGLERFIRNGETYKPIVEKIFSNYGLPTDLYYVGIVESGFQNRARSHAGAVGPWQFIKGTARRYGLKVTSSIDERKNIFKSTEAAALYFQDLYNIFGSWELALAAYNAGEYGIIRRIRGANTREYYELSKRKIIPKETRHYVPKVLAVKEIIENPKKYGIKIGKPRTNIFAHTKSVKIKNSIKVSKLARKLGVSTRTLKSLNHDILGAYIPYLGRKGYEVFIPNSSMVSESDINQFLASKPTPKVYKESALADGNYHTVRKNESLYSISKRYGVKLTQIKKINKLRSSTIFIGQKIRIPGEVHSKTLSSYTVKKGDNLYKIASIFKTKVNRLKGLNNMRKSSIYIGQKLKVPAHKTHYHIVKKGDHLTQIAKQNSISLSELKNLNQVNSFIYPGQKLIVKIELI